MLATVVPERPFGGRDVEPSPTPDKATPLDEARDSPIDQIDRAAAAQIKERVMRSNRSEVTFSFGSAI
jgi:hypothetical protein